MAGSQTLSLKFKGLYTNPNSLGAVPEGALLTAKNIVIDKEDVVEPRRGYKLFGNAMGTGSADVCLQMTNYKERLIRHYETTSRGILEYMTTVGGSTFAKFNQRRMNFASSLTCFSTTATFTCESDHGLLPGDIVTIAGATQAAYNITATVIATPASNSFTYTVVGAPASPATGDPVLVESTVNAINEPVAGYKVKFAEVNGNLYFTSSVGVKKIDDYNSTIVNAGTPKALDSELELYDDAEGFFLQDTQVAYKVLWGYKDANDNLLLGAPGERVTIANPAISLFISDFNALLTKLDTDAGVNDTNYNSTLALLTNATISQANTKVLALTAKLDADGGGGGVADTNYTAGLPNNPATTVVELQENFDYITAKLNLDAGVTYTNYPLATTAQNVKVTFTVPDLITPNHFFQVYRSSMSAGVDVEPFNDFKLVYEGNPTYAQLNDKLLEIIDDRPEVLREPALELYTNTNQEGPTQANDEPPFAKDIALYNGITFYANTKTKYQLAVDLISAESLGATSTLVFDDGTTPFTISFSTTAENTSTGTALVNNSLFNDQGSPSLNNDATARSIVRVINRYASNTFVNAYYISGSTDLPGKMLFVSRLVTNPQFTVQATNSTFTDGVGNVISMYSPELIDEEPSTNEQKSNRLYYSKLQEPEAVPALNFINVGPGDNVIERIADLRDGLFIFSSKGVYKVVGDTPDSLSLVLFDTTTIQAPETLAKGNNQIYFFADDGITVLKDSGLEVISRRIEDKLLKLLTAEFTSFRTSTFGMFYDSDKKYILFTIENTTDTEATIAYVYNTYTDTWTSWDVGKSCGIVYEVEDVLYLGATDTNYIEKERKNFNYTDHADREYARSIISYNRYITTINTGNPSQILCYQHGLETGMIITIADSDSTPSIDGTHVVTVIDDNNFSIPVNVTVAGTTAAWTTEEDVPYKIQLDSLTGVNVGDAIVQTQSATVGTTTYSYEIEAIITEVNDLHTTVTVNNSSNYLTGACTVYDYIDVEMTWVPQHAGNPGDVKHFREAHLMFDKYRGYGIKMQFSSDVKKGNALVELPFEVIPNWGRFPWGRLPWGGNPSTREMRTYLPMDKQRCRLLNITYKSDKAREKWRLEGISLIYRLISNRTQRE